MVACQSEGRSPRLMNQEWFEGRRKRNSKLGGDRDHGLIGRARHPQECEFALQRPHILALARIGQTELSKIAVLTGLANQVRRPGFRWADLRAHNLRGWPDGQGFRAVVQAPLEIAGHPLL